MEQLATLNALTQDPSVPSLFEVISAEQLGGLLAPSARYVVAHFAQRYPRQLLGVLNRFDEAFAVVMGAIEARSLATWNASVTEKFYGIKRTRALAFETVVAADTNADVAARVQELARLRRRDVWASAVAVVGVPYAAARLDRLYESLRPDATGLAAVFRRVYPALRSAATAGSLALQLLYLCGRSPVHSLTTLLLRVRLARLGAADYARDRTRARGRADGALAALLPAAVFVLKLLDWWYASGFARQLSRSARRRRADAPDAPVALPPPAQPAAARPEACPLCEKPVTNPAALETGYVFCYPCIYRHLQEQPAPTARCPVSGQRLLSCTYDAGDCRWDVSGALRRIVV
ncbi:Pex12 amino terminal region-domain-containing protein [Dipodascopsis tothii]|uniref:Pex12 amino terminal region-domain-containing protein n=1 Tax=Dipodascopsis tothii TaxID=44089 RepID=UPI0034CE0B8E